MHKNITRISDITSGMCYINSNISTLCNIYTVCYPFVNRPDAVIIISTVLLYSV